MVKNMRFLLGGHKSRGGSVCIPPETLAVKSLGGGGPFPTNKGVSYTNLVSSLVVTLKIDYYYYYMY
jgi:hypothetical protein